MKRSTKHKVVTSGRLTGGGKAQLRRGQTTPNPGPSAFPEPAYSLYSTDSEDQVTTLHQGLDRCAALLSGMLQANQAALPSLSRAVTGGVAKSRPSTSLGKKIIKKPPRKTVQRNLQSCQHGAGSTTPRKTHQFIAPAAHTGVKLHPPQRQPYTPPQSPVPPPQPKTSVPPTQPQPQTSVPPTQPKTSVPPPQPLPHTSVPQPQFQPQTSVPPTQPQTSVPPPQPLPHTSVPQTQPQPQTSVPPTQPQTSVPPTQPQTSILLSVLQSSSHFGQRPLRQTDCQSASEAPNKHSNAECDREEEEFVPVRDSNIQSTATDTHTVVRQKHSHTHTCTAKMSNMHLKPEQLDEIPWETHSRENSSADAEVKAKTVRYLLGELKALVAGQGSVADRLLSHLGQVVSSPLMNVSSSNIPAENVQDLSSLHSQNIQLNRTLNQQLQEKVERQQTMETLCDSEVMTLQEELTTAQSQLQELQDNLAELWQAHQDTQSRLRGREAENAVIKTELEATRSRLVDIELEKCELASLAQKRLDEIGNLNSSVSDTLPTKRHQPSQHPAETPTQHITQYMISLGQLDPTHAERVYVPARSPERSPQEQKKLISVHLRDTLTHADVISQQGNELAETSACQKNSHLHQSHCLGEVQSCGQVAEMQRGRLLNSTLSQCDVESVWSESTFDTRDEAAFRDGLAALDASIASLQKTIQMDLRR